jgi:hypothetical protein
MTKNRKKGWPQGFDYKKTSVLTNLLYKNASKWRGLDGELFKT